MGAAGKYNIQINQGASFELSFQIKDSDGSPINIAGSSFIAKLRRTASDPNTIATFTAVIVDASLGKGKMSLTPTETLNISVDPSTLAYRKITAAAYDLTITYSGGIKQRLLEGVANISPEVSTEDES